MIKDPYGFEFLGFPKDRPVMESDSEKTPSQNINVLNNAINSPTKGAFP